MIMTTDFEAEHFGKQELSCPDCVDLGRQRFCREIPEAMTLLSKTFFTCGTSAESLTTLSILLCVFLQPITFINLQFSLAVCCFVLIAVMSTLFAIVYSTALHLLGSSRLNKCGANFQYVDDLWWDEDPQLR